MSVVALAVLLIFRRKFLRKKISAIQKKKKKEMVYFSKLFPQTSEVPFLMASRISLAEKHRLTNFPLAFEKTVGVST